MTTMILVDQIYFKNSRIEPQIENHNKRKTESSQKPKPPLKPNLRLMKMRKKLLKKQPKTKQLQELSKKGHI